jgi:hypothetical protein
VREREESESEREREREESESEREREKTERVTEVRLRFDRLFSPPPPRNKLVHCWIV